MVYVGPGAGDRTQLWIKKRSELHATPLGGTAGAGTAFVSRDGAWIGFIAHDKAMKVPVSGGPPVTLADAVCAGMDCETYVSGAFLDDGSVVFSSRDALVRVGPNGGAADSIVTAKTVGGFASLQPSPLPRSRGILFTACTLYCHRADVWVLDLVGHKARPLIRDASRPTYLPTGYVLYVDQQGNAFAAPFDPETLALRGPATRVADRVRGSMSVSHDGTLVYAEGDPSPRSEVVIVSHDGKAQSVDSTWRADFSTLALSPDGRRVAVSIVTVGEEQLWVKALGGGPPVRLTFDRAQYTTPTWTADGASILVTRFAGDSSSFLSRRADGTGGNVVLKRGTDWVIESDVSRDGEWLVQREYRRSGARDIYARRLRGDTSTHTVVATPASDVSPALSPDGKWLAYASEESGRTDVWVVPFPQSGDARWQVSSDGGWEPVWSRDGRELYYVNDARELVAATVRDGPRFTIGARRVLFPLNQYRRHPTHRAYAALPGNRGFVMIRDGSPTTGDLVMVDHWFTELAQKVRQP